jgi:glucokinase
MILAGDVGGTKVALALYEFSGGRLQVVREQKYPAPAYPGLTEVVRAFLGRDRCEPGEVIATCFGVPGPVRDGRIKPTNLPWQLDVRVLGPDLGVEHVFLINDLEANGYGIAELRPDQLHVLAAGDGSTEGNAALVSAGTGLGEAILAWNGGKHMPMASEGGHADFAARNDMEIDLLRYLMRTLGGRVSTERVVSGLGLKNIYAFLRDDKGIEEPAWLRDRMASEDRNVVIGELGESGANELCAKTLDIFASAYGAEAGNMALKVLATGGVYLGGGVAPKMLQKLQDGAFMKAFTDKGRLRGIVEKCPVRIILEQRAALLGAAAYAEARAAEISGISLRAGSL